MQKELRLLCLSILYRALVGLMQMNLDDILIVTIFSPLQLHMIHSYLCHQNVTWTCV